MTDRKISLVMVAMLILLGASLATCAAATAPTVSISAPRADAVVTGDAQDISVAASAADGAQIAYLELYVDGSLHTAKRLSPPVESGKVALSWATSQSFNGEHAVSVVVHDTAGESAQASVRLRLDRANGRELPLPSISITGPRDGATISGKTPVTMEASAPGGVKYAMLFIDEIFTCFTNMPPFTYIWNTARSENGQHVLQAKAFDDAEREGASKKITVTVNNPGGRTTMETKPAAAAAPSVSVAAPASAAPVAKGQLAAPRPQPKQQEPVRIAQLPAIKATPQPAKAAVQVAAVASAAPVVKAAAAPAPMPAPSKPATAAPIRVAPAVTAATGAREPVKMAQALARVSGATAPATTAKPVLIAKAPTATPKVSVIEETPAGVVLHTVRPGQELGRIAQAYGVAAETLASANGLEASAALAAGETLRVPVAQGALYLNGKRLASDVPTVFVNGIAAGPFRYIIERAGGTVVWLPADRSITATGLGKNVRLWVGKAQAKVDGRAVTLDVATFIENGRAIVPLRFFRDALDYAVSYDEGTGRITIARR